MADIFGGFSCIRSAGYLELHVVPPIMRGTSNHAVHLGLCMVPQIVLESFH